MSFRRAVNELEGTTLDNEANGAVVNVGVLRMGVEVPVGGDNDGGLVVTLKGGWFSERRENFANEIMQPYCLLGSVG